MSIISKNFMEQKKIYKGNIIIKSLKSCFKFNNVINSNCAIFGIGQNKKKYKEKLQKEKKKVHTGLMWEANKWNDFQSSEAEKRMKRWTINKLNQKIMNIFKN